MALDPALCILPGMTTRTQTTANRTPGSGTAGTLGRRLRQWRERRRLSQLGLAVDAKISSWHLSFIETGRAQPSRDMVLLLSRVLEVPPRGRNDLLTAA
jgi:DNA-binding XRE family transcriptional regulator